MREEISAVQKELQNLKEQSFAMELLQDMRKTNKRMFIIWVITFILLIGMACYTIFLLNDISNVNTNTIDIEDVENIDNSHIKIGKDIWEE